MDESLDWTLRHGRTVALSYAIFDAPAKLHEIISNDVITKSVLTQACADRVCTIRFHSSIKSNQMLVCKQPPPVLLVASLHPSLPSL